MTTQTTKRAHLPRWLARINKRIFNPLEIKRGKRPVLTHVGRDSGRSLETPLDAHPTDDGWLFIPMYGPQSDWVLNILEAGSAELKVDDERHALANPRLVGRDEAWAFLPARAQKQGSITRLDHFLVMETVPADGGSG